ncbi:MAG: hypothetical protein AB8H79_23650 [Myxococcota bacterium]
MSAWTDWAALAREPMFDWTQLKSTWTDGWKSLERSSIAKYAGAIVRTPETFRPTVEAFFAELAASRASIERITQRAAALPPAERAAAMDQARSFLDRWRTLAAGALAESKPAVQGPPVVLIIVGLVLGVGAIAWAVAAYQYAVNLREQTALAEKELEARILASEQGRQLPVSTLPNPPSGGVSMMTWMVLAGVVVGGIALGPTLLKQVGGRQ